MKIYRPSDTCFDEMKRRMNRRALPEDSVRDTVNAIIQDVSARGDEALFDYASRFDKAHLDSSSLFVTEAELAEAEAMVEGSVKEAIAVSLANIHYFSDRSRRQDWSGVNAQGVEVAERFLPYDRVGIYIPGGKAPLAVFLTVPIAVLGAYAGLFWQGMELTLYAQIGLVMLVGLAAKNAILIVEFANLEMQRGKGLMEATLAAARLRLRPILMTSLAFVLGCIPLMLSSGSGALARNAIGTVVVIGMGVATLVGAFLIPCSYVFIMRLFRIKFSLNDLKEDPDEVGARKYLAAHTKD